MAGRPPQKSRQVTTVFVTLQREPPLIRIFAPGRLAPSSRTTDTPGLFRRVKIAVARPAAPAPTMRTSDDTRELLLVRCGRVPGPFAFGRIEEVGQVVDRERRIRGSIRRDGLRFPCGGDVRSGRGPGTESLHRPAQDTGLRGGVAEPG